MGRLLGCLTLADAVGTMAFGRSPGSTVDAFTSPISPDREYRITPIMPREAAQ